MAVVGIVSWFLSVWPALALTTVATLLAVVILWIASRDAVATASFDGLETTNGRGA